MCGILWMDRNGASVNKMLAKKYQAQKHRGTQGFAFLTAKGGVVKNIERAMEEEEILEKLEKDLSNYILFHHRFPTSTINIPSATHPIVVENEALAHNYYVVHNGVISNCAELRKEHEKLGFVYNTAIQNTLSHIGTDGVEYVSEITETFNDSEALAVELALYLEGKQTSIGARGGIAFICLQTDKKGKMLNLFFGRNEGNPLIMDTRNGAFSLASEGTGESIKPDTMYHYELGVEREIVSFPLDIGLCYRKPAIGYGSGHGYQGGDYSHDNDRVWDHEKGKYCYKWELDARKPRTLIPELPAPDSFIGEVETALWLDLEMMEAEITALSEDIEKATVAGEDTSALRLELEELQWERESIENDILVSEAK